MPSDDLVSKTPGPLFPFRAGFWLSAMSLHARVPGVPTKEVARLQGLLSSASDSEAIARTILRGMDCPGTPKIAVQRLSLHFPLEGQRLKRLLA